MQYAIHKMPPQSLEAESSVIGMALISQDCAYQAIGILRHTDFYKHAHAIIFKAITSLHDKSENIDIVNLIYELTRMDKLDDVGGPAYIAPLTDVIPSMASVKSHCALIKHKADLRRTIETSNRIIDQCYCDDGLPAESMLEDLEKVIYESSVQRNLSGFKHISEILTGVMDKIKMLSNGDIKTLGIPTGYDDIDFILNGLKPAELVIIAGRPSMGKTSLAMNIIENICEKGMNQAIFSLEMNCESLAFRALASQSKIDSYKLQNGRLSADDWGRLKNACSKLSNLGIFIDDMAGLSPYDIRSRARRIKEKFDIKTIWIDYLQLSHTKSRSKEEETSIISREFKAMAKELNVPVIALSQLSRSCESRNDKKPMLSDLRDSGAIEQDADVVAFVYRDEMYNTRTDNPKKGIAEILIKKNRNGPTGTAELVFRGGITRFENRISI